MILNQNIEHNKTCDDLHSIEPPVFKLTKLNTPVTTIKTKMTDYSESISQNGQNSTASSRKASMDNSLCGQCSDSLCEDCAFIERNVLSDAASNLSEAMSSIESQTDLDEISEVWELSSICTENSLQSKKKKIVKYLHIKSMITDASTEDSSPSLDEVLPIFEQIEKSSRVNQLNQAVDYESAVVRCCLMSSQAIILQSSQKAYNHRGEESKSVIGLHYREQSNNIVNSATTKGKKIDKVIRKQKQPDYPNGGSPSGVIKRISEKTWQPMTTQVSKLSTIIEEETSQDEDPQTDCLPAASHCTEVPKPPTLKEQALVFLSFNLMNQRILESATKRANKYLERVPRSSQNFNGMLSMVTEVYRMLLLPEGALSLYLSCLSDTQCLEEGQQILRRLCPKTNRHQNISQALEKVRKFYQI